MVVVPPKGACRGPMSSALPSHSPGARSTRPAGRAPGTSSGQSGEQPPGPGHHGPLRSRSARTGRTPAPVSRNRRATSRPSTGLFLSSVALNRRQSFHQGLHRPLNTPISARPTRARRASRRIPSPFGDPAHCPQAGPGRPPPPDVIPVARPRNSNEYFLESHGSDPFLSSPPPSNPGPDDKDHATIPHGRR